MAPAAKLPKYTKQYTFNSPHRQDFSLPGPFMLYLSQNWSGFTYEKIIQSCKYFFAWHQIVPMKALDFENHPWRRSGISWGYDELNYQLSNGEVNVNLKKCKLWLYNWLACADKIFPNFFSSFLESVYRCTPTFLGLWNQNIEFELLSKISTNVIDIDIDDTTFFYPNKSEASLWDILTVMPKLEMCSIVTESKELSVLLGKISTLPTLPNLKNFSFSGLPKADFSVFSEFIKLHPNTDFRLMLDEEYPNFNVEEFEVILKKLFPPSSIGYWKNDYEYHFIVTLNNQEVNILIH